MSCLAWSWSQRDGPSGFELGLQAVTREPVVFAAQPRWRRILFRWWRSLYCRLPGDDRHGLPRATYRYIVPPREWSQEQADAAIQRGRELAKEHGW